MEYSADYGRLADQLKFKDFIFSSYNVRFIAINKYVDSVKEKMILRSSKIYSMTILLDSCLKQSKV